MKVSKEDIIGVIAALEVWFGERDEAAERKRWDDDCATIAARVAQIPGVTSEVIEPAGVDRVPRLKIIWNREKYPLDGLGLRNRVLDGEPRVMLDDNSATENSIAVEPFQLQPGEAQQVGDAVVGLGNAGGVGGTPSVAAGTVTGVWASNVESTTAVR